MLSSRESGDMVQEIGQRLEGVQEVPLQAALEFSAWDSNQEGIPRL